ncbi:O-antigen polysaccharide polymerase Wzy [Thalassobacillus sp. C254]|uniref:O-antigen polysaccharide polymerase Wzy n=1 Tax=Thalassobacillus sp. C254 TaxID=1225341 RepID=UPI0006D24C0C|nr:O-antigen polysaccharide polymerase Wzy [Thalassobacillus sp. C254]
MQSQMVRKATITRLNFGIGLLTLFLTIFGYLLYLLTLSLVNSNKEYDIIVFLFSWVGILLGFYICFTWYKITKVIFTPYIIFMLFFFLFNYGQPLMWAFGIHNSMEIGEASLYGLGIANTNDIIKAQALTLVSILMFHAGALFCYKTESQNITVDNQLEKHERDKTNTFKAIYYTCFLVGLIVIPATLIFSFVDLQTALTYGYNSLYYSDHARSGLNLTVLEHLFFHV